MGASRPTIGLAMIVKNEAKNLPRLFESIAGCFDNVHITDTGSNDGTVEWLKEYGPGTAKCPVHVHHFEWIDDFGAARNHAFAPVKDDYVMWLDGDDVLSDRDGFVKWRDGAMQFHDMWLAPYWYSIDKDGKPVVNFVRERVIRNNLKPMWKYFIHEGIDAKPHWTRAPIFNWVVKHLRDEQDVQNDRSRNIKIFEKKMREQALDGRMQFYYGKELFEASRHAEAVIALEKALTMSLEHHDKLLTHQYASYACMMQGDQLKDEFMEQKRAHWERGIQFAVDGLKMEPNRAEFHITIGDAYLKRGELLKCVPHYGAAKVCINMNPAGAVSQGAIFSFAGCYGEVPSLQLSKVYFNLGRLEEAKAEAQECVDKYKSEEAKGILKELDRIKGLISLDNGQEQTEDIVFTCPPQSAYEFDEEIYKTKPLGGSETALVQMAKELKRKTKRPVKVFSMRTTDLVADSGVEYIDNKKATEYFSKFRPKVNVAWRHNMEMTSAKSAVWSHDLVTPGCESRQTFDTLMCLTPFHKEYVQGMQNVPDNKIWVTRNGVTPEKFDFPRPPKNPNKLVWMSSPDRGLDRAMLVCDKVRETYPDIELHVYYGIENLYKYGLAALAEKIKEMMDERPWVKYHGFTEQSQMYREVADAAVWPHCCNFIETSCITAMEMLALKVFPVTRRLGGLQDTLREAEERGHAVLLDHDATNPEEIAAYAKEVCAAIAERKWERIEFDMEKNSWSSVADEWIQKFEL